MYIYQKANIYKLEEKIKSLGYCIPPQHLLLNENRMSGTISGHIFDHITT